MAFHTEKICPDKCGNLYLVGVTGSRGCVVLRARCCFCLRIVVEGDVVHAQVWLQALEGAVGGVQGAAAAVAAHSHRIGDRGLHSRRTSRQLIGLVVEALVGAHVLINLVERDLNDWILEE